MSAINRYENNDFVHRLPALPFAEMDRIGRALNHLAATLSRAQEERRALSLKLVSSQEEERAKIARELHDEFGQTLTAMRADVAWLSHRTAGADEMHAVVRELGRTLRALPCAGARSAAPACVRKERTRVRREFRCSSCSATWCRAGAIGPASARSTRSNASSARTRCPQDLALALYRLTQEALTNAARHADATHVAVHVAADASGDVEWCAEDDGIGLDSVESAAHRGNGLAGMRERVWAHGGEIEMSRARGESWRTRGSAHSRAFRGCAGAERRKAATRASTRR